MHILPTASQSLYNPSVLTTCCTCGDGDSEVDDASDQDGQQGAFGDSQLGVLRVRHTMCYYEEQAEYRACDDDKRR